MIAINANQDPDEFIERIASTVTKPERFAYQINGGKLIFLRTFASDLHPLGMCRVEVAVQDSSDSLTVATSEVTDADFSEDPKQIRMWTVMSKTMPKKVDSLADLIGND